MSLSFGNQRILKNIDFELNNSEIISIIGRSGCGKTTFLRSLIFLEIFDEGKFQIDDILIDSLQFEQSKKIGKKFQNDIWMDNASVFSDPTIKQIIYAIRHKVGFLFQSLNLFPHLTVLENVTLPLKLTLNLTPDLADQKAKTSLENFGLLDYANRYPSQLSGGQQQRVAICRAIVLEPKIMLYDEPTSALDPELIKDIISIMHLLKQEGMSQIVVTHSISLAKSISDKVIYMEDGEFIESNTPDIIFNSPQDERTQKYINKVIIK